MSCQRVLSLAVFDLRGGRGPEIPDAELHKGDKMVDDGAVLVTGAAGFVALNVVENLLTAGRQVVGLDRIALPERAVRDFARLPGRLTMIDGSILSAADLSQALSVAPVTAVIHCAVITAGTQREIADPGAIIAVNIDGAVATLMAAVRHGVKRFVYPSSGAVYGASAATVTVMDEDSLRPAPVNLYGLTKFAAEIHPGPGC